MAKKTEVVEVELSNADKDYINRNRSQSADQLAERTEKPKHLVLAYLSTLPAVNSRDTSTYIATIDRTKDAGYAYRNGATVATKASSERGDKRT